MGLVAVASPIKLRLLTLANALLAATVVCCSTTSAIAQAPFMVLSNGQDSCGQFLAANDAKKMIDVEWILGFLSGQNSLAQGNSRMVGRSVHDIQAIAAWMQEFCRSHALDYMPAAAEALRTELSERESDR